MDFDKEVVSVITSALLTVVALVGVWLYRRYQATRKANGKQGD